VANLGPVSRAALELTRELAIAVRSSFAVRGFRRLEGAQDLRVHLGCGADVRPGWVNIDVGAPPGDGLVIRHDLRRGLPLPSESCALIYSSHFFEHLEYRAGVRLMRDCHRALRPGGVLRFALPNFRALFEAYVQGDANYLELIDHRQALPDREPGTETLVDGVNYGVYQFGEHKTIYDEEKLIAVLGAIGFRSVSGSSFIPEIDPRDPVRRRYSFYLEAFK
jgi:predicted SAM-dependent methyltransferase